MTADLAGHARELAGWLRDNAERLAPWRRRPPGSLAAAVEHDRGLLALLHEAGWSRYGWPEQAGGLGGPVALRAVLYDELAAADVEVPEAYVILETLGPLLTAFAPDLAATHLPRFLRGEELWGQGFSEPEAGSDLAGLRTRAEAAGNGFVVNGQKIWTTLGQFASHAAVLARTGAPDSAHRGLTMLWVDLGQPGASVRPIPASSGRDEFAEMFFEDARVDGSRVIGEVGGGWAAAMYLLQYERGMYAWLRQAILHRRLREVAAMAPAGASPSSLAALGRAQRVCAGLRARSRTTVLRLSAGENPGPEISVDKVLLGQAEQAVFDAWRQLCWEAMAVDDGDLSSTLREEWFYSRASTIFGGAADIQRDILSDRVLRLPRGAR
ncbi:acyl-CoA dehydrogenase family protein [Nocardioides caldifontis]|uniref:acyl-CoA dehydrogenase family protein n=1 Tax=Nocardioides caldifontis TaxID=2588938 RepID=UPI00193A7305|nr:acyl-CoA dehydrogenase family protein [Nocardioides caldifontis]